MVKTKSFPLAAVLTVTTERLLCKIEDVYAILNYITGDNLFTHALPRANRFSKPLVLSKYPELSAASAKLKELDELLKRAKECNISERKACKVWLTSLGLENKYAIESHADAWLSHHPVEELQSML